MRYIQFIVDFHKIRFKNDHMSNIRQRSNKKKLQRIPVFMTKFKQEKKVFWIHIISEMSFVEWPRRFKDAILWLTDFAIQKECFWMSLQIKCTIFGWFDCHLPSSSHLWFVVIVVVGFIILLNAIDKQYTMQSLDVINCCLDNIQCTPLLWNTIWSI